MLPWFSSFQSLSCVHRRSSTRILQHNHTSVVRLARTTIFLFSPPSETSENHPAFPVSFPPTAPSKLVPDASHFKLWNVRAAATNSATRSSQSCVIVVVNSGRTGNNLKQLFWRKEKTPPQLCVDSKQDHYGELWVYATVWRIIDLFRVFGSETLLFLHVKRPNLTERRPQRKKKTLPACEIKLNELLCHL